jgi:hypothetical protein
MFQQGVLKGKSILVTGGGAGAGRGTTEMDRPGRHA